MDGVRDITIAILAHNKEKCLPLYLQCIYNQTYHKGNLHLYIRTNDNRDRTTEILHDWLALVKDEYSSFYIDDSSIDKDLEQVESHDWNSHRFSILGRIRQESVDYAISKNSHYFVSDCDNFIHKHTLQSMYDSGKFAIAPMLPSTEAYTNFHYKVDNSGFFVECKEYYDFRYYRHKGVIAVDCIHCTYFIRDLVLPLIYYDDGTETYEYIIFSRSLRRLYIEQHIDNTSNYGKLTFNDDPSDEPWITEFYDAHFSMQFGVVQGNEL